MDDKELKKTALYRRIIARYKKALAHHALIEDGDRILLGLSGGKDSLCLMELLGGTKRIHRPKIVVEAFHVRMANIAYESDTRYLEEFAAECDVPLHVVTTQFDASTDKRKSPCFLCSWNRRKQLFNYAQEHGFNKIALGHHQDDIIHTALMNAFFQGHFSSMPPKLKMDKMPLTLIRPLCHEHEEDLREYARLRGYVSQKKVCPYENDSCRADIRSIFEAVERLNPEARYSIWHALENLTPSSSQKGGNHSAD